MSQGDNNPLSGKSEEQQIRELEEQRQKELKEAAERIAEREKRERESAQARLVEQQQELTTEAQRIAKRDEAERALAEKREQERQKELQAIAKRLQEEQQQEGQESLLRSKELAAEVEVSRMISASLQTPGVGQRTDSVDRPKPEIFYVIVGRGPAAVIDHTLLRQTKWGRDRIGTLKVMHIGFQNPWAKFMEHGMGQPPHLLSLPGFKDEPPNATVDGGLNSKRFAAHVIDAEFARLAQTYTVRVNDGWVAYIQSRAGWVMAQTQPPIDGPLKKSLMDEGMLQGFIDHLNTKLKAQWENLAARYRVLVMAAKPLDQIDPSTDLTLIYAAYVDICTGAGRPAVFPVENEPAIYKDARTKPWLPAETWTSALKTRKVLNAVDSIRDEAEWSEGERVCVTAGGGVGLNAAERSTNNNCWLDWFGRTTLMDTFNNPRNDTILKHPTEDRRLDPGERPKLNITKDDQITPFAPRSRFGYGAALSAVAAGNAVKVTLKKSGEATPKIRDRFAKQVELHSAGYWLFSAEYQEAYSGKAPSLDYDRLVIPNGQNTGAVGQPYQFARHLSLSPLTADDGRMLGLDTVDGNVRVLGAAAQNYPQMDRNAGPPPAGRMWEYWDSLPVSAVPDGFIFSAANIATAKHFFAEKPNTNLNTMTEEEITAKLQGAGIQNAGKLATLLIDARKRPKNNGYATVDEAVQAVATSLKSGDESEFRKLFRVNYAPSPDTNLLPALTVETVEV